MGEIPIQALLVPFLGAASIVYWLVMRRRALAEAGGVNKDYRIGAIAQRLGLKVVSGDADFNLLTDLPQLDLVQGPRDGRPVHIEIRMQGTRDGIPLEFVFYYRVEQETQLLKTTWRTWYDCRMIAYPRQAFPAFEVVTRKPPIGRIKRQLSLPQMGTGVVEIDGYYEVTTQEPAMAPLLAEHLRAFHEFGNAGLHVVGDGTSVSFPLQRHQSPLLPMAMYYEETMARELVRLAQRVGG